MNDPRLLAGQLEALLQMAKDAESPYEKAAVYAATTAIDNAFHACPEKFNGYVLEKVSNTCGYINAIVGYDIDNGHDASQHASWAYGELMTLEELLEA